MTGRNKQFTITIADAARRIVQESGADITKQVTILPLAKLLMTDVGCGIDAAKRHIAKAVRRLRGEWVEAQHGGIRPGSGWPKGVPRGPRTAPHTGGWPKGVKRAGQRGKKVE